MQLLINDLRLTESGLLKITYFCLHLIVVTVVIVIKPKLECQKAKDKRGKRIQGLWQRGNVFYAQLRATNPTTGKRRPQKLAMDEAITTIPQALQASAEMRGKESGGASFAGGPASRRLANIAITA